MPTIENIQIIHPNEANGLALLQKALSLFRETPAEHDGENALFFSKIYELEEIIFARVGRRISKHITFLAQEEEGKPNGGVQ